MTGRAEAPPLDEETAREARDALSAERLRELLYWMKLQRAVEERVVALYKQGKIVGGVYTGRGHEAIGVGSAVHMGDEDVIFPTHRDLGAFLLKGMTPATVLAQYLGRVDGPTRGKDGNLHMGEWNLGIGAFVSHMADTVPVAVGVGFSFRYRGESNVVVCYNGDGATSRGDWHEGINMAAVQGLPVVFVCVNNGFAYSTPVSRQMAIDRVAERASGYGIPGETVDGNDVLAVWSSARRATERARGGGGPTLLEYRTYRMTGHSEHDPAEYVPEEFLEEGRRRDPIRRYTRWLREEGVLNGDGLDHMEEQIDNEVRSARERAERSPEPEPEEALEGVFADPVPPGTRGDGRPDNQGGVA